MNPILSVIIPTHNRAMLLCRTLKSVLSMKGVSMEIIVCDDASEDDTAEKMSSFTQRYDCISYVRNDKNYGCGYTRHRAYLLSKGRYVVFADDDDYYTNPDFFRKALEVLEADSSLSFCGANVSFSELESGELKPRCSPFRGKYDGLVFLRDYLTRGGKPVSTFSSVFRREMLDKADFAEMKMMNDTSIYMRALLYGNAYILSDNIGVYCLHFGNLSNHLTCDFILANLEEKMWVCRRACEIGKVLPPQWLSEQFNMIMVYYLSGNQVRFQELFRIYTYAKQQHACSLYDLLEWIIRKVLWRMRRALRGG